MIKSIVNKFATANKGNQLMALVDLFCLLVFVGAMSFAFWPADVSMHFSA